MDAPYSNREIDSHFQEIKETLSRIESQTTKTNGRVTRLESWKNTSIGWTGGVGACLFIIIGLSVFIFKSEINNLSLQEEKTQTALASHVNK